MTDTQKTRTNTKDDHKDRHKDRSDRHRCSWTGTSFKYISKRGNLFRVRVVKNKQKIYRLFRSLVDAQDFLSSLGADLVEKAAQNAKA